MAFFPRPNEYEVAEITWENGQLAMHGHGRASDTLESIVHQATTCYHQSQNQYIDQQKSQNQPRTGDIASSSGNLGDPSYVKKRPRLSHDECGRNFENFNEDTSINSKDNDTTMMTWPSFDSPNQSLKSKNTDDDSACQYLSENQEEECKTEGETVRSRSSRRSRSAAIHNQSERRRREKINQKMKALQKLVPNANKMDKASMLDEVIDYLKKLQAQVKLMNNMPIASPSPPQMMMIPMPLQLQQQHHHHQMSMLARMRMMGMAGILPSPHHPIMVPQTTAGPAHVAATSQPLPATNTGTAPFGDSYTAFLAQSMNMDIYNNMAALFQRQVNQVAKSTVNTSHQDK